MSVKYREVGIQWSCWNKLITAASLTFCWTPGGSIVGVVAVIDAATSTLSFLPAELIAITTTASVQPLPEGTRDRISTSPTGPGQPFSGFSYDIVQRWPSYPLWTVDKGGLSTDCALAECIPWINSINIPTENSAVIAILHLASCHHFSCQKFS